MVFGNIRVLKFIQRKIGKIERQIRVILSADSVPPRYEKSTDWIDEGKGFSSWKCESLTQLNDKSSCRSYWLNEKKARDWGRHPVENEREIWERYVGDTTGEENIRRKSQNDWKQLQKAL